MELQPRVIVLGHSYVARLEDFMYRSGRKYGNLDLRRQQATVECFGVGGAVISTHTARSLDRVVDFGSCFDVT